MVPSRATSQIGPGGSHVRWITYPLTVVPRCLFPIAHRRPHAGRASPPSRASRCSCSPSGRAASTPRLSIAVHAGFLRSHPPHLHGRGALSNLRSARRSSRPRPGRGHRPGHAAAPSPFPARASARHANQPLIAATSPCLFDEAYGQRRPYGHVRGEGLGSLVMTQVDTVPRIVIFCLLLLASMAFARHLRRAQASTTPPRRGRTSSWAPTTTPSRRRPRGSTTIMGGARSAMGEKDLLSKDPYAACALCPRRCGARRAQGRPGGCGMTSELRVARSALHFWEEPPISGEAGSGTIFFSGCPLGVVRVRSGYVDLDVAHAKPDVGRLLLEEPVVPPCRAHGRTTRSLARPRPSRPTRMPRCIRREPVLGGRDAVDQTRA